MRRPVLSILTALSLTSLTVVIGACATSPTTDDNLDALATDTAPTEGEPASSKLPPPSTSSTAAPQDAGTDAQSAPKDASTPPKDASTPPTDSGSTSASGGDCDQNNPIYALEFFAASKNPTPCPCSASECCFMATACVPK